MSLSKLFLFNLLFTFSLFAYPHYSLAVKEKKIYPMGAKIYAKKCKKIDVGVFKSYEELYRTISEKNLCSTTNKRYLDAVSLYLWDKTRRAKQTKIYEKLTVSKDDKCPVCGMFLYKYPKWVARIKYKEKSFSFDGIKDMMKYYFKNKQGVQELLVQDYYTGETLNAKIAFFVLGSDIYGPMGNELIAFKSLSSAQRFKQDHKGKKILRFQEITVKRVDALDK